MIGQENKCDIIQEYCKENHTLKLQIVNLKNEIEASHNHIKNLLNQIKHYKKIIKDFSKGSFEKILKKESYHYNDQNLIKNQIS